MRFLKGVIFSLTLTSAITSLQGCVPLVAVGVGGAYVAADTANDSISVGTKIDDQGIKMSAVTILKDIPALKEVSNVEIMVHNANILLAGQVPSDTVKATLSERMSAIEGVNTVYNELTIGKKLTMTEFAEDTLTSTRVKTGFLGNVNPSQFRVLTEKGVVYLMAYTTKEEGAYAADLASQVHGVKRVVTIYDFITEEKI